MFSRFPKIRILEVGLTLMLLTTFTFVSCGGGAIPAEEEPLPQVELPDQPQLVLPETVQLDHLVFPDSLSMAQNNQLINSFIQADTIAVQSLESGFMNYNPQAITAVGDMKLNWEMGNAIYIMDDYNNYQVDVLAVPVTLSDPNALSPEVLAVRIAAGDISELAVGGMMVLSNIEASLQSGNYLAVWHPDVDQVWLVNLQTNSVDDSAYCEASSTTLEPYFELYEGSLGWCLNFDSRRCCI